jgi:hypothetical protein
MGFERFMDAHNTRMAPWFAELEQDLHADNTSTSRKLAVLQSCFGESISQLEAGRPRTM